MTFNYTDADREIDSTVVYEAYYNAPTKELALVLESGYGYVYSDVPKYTYDRLVGGFHSAGKIYNREVKGAHKSRELGYVGEYNETEFVKGVPAPNMGPVKVSAKGMPQHWITSGSIQTPNGLRINLGLDPVKPEAPEGVKYNHAVYFEVAGLGNTPKVFNVEAGSVTEAVEALSEATAALGLDVNVKEVRTYFE